MATLLNGCWLNFRHFEMVLSGVQLFQASIAREQVGWELGGWVIKTTMYIGEGERSGHHFFGYKVQTFSAGISTMNIQVPKVSVLASAQ